jgi:hypothetical protein
MDTRNDSLRIAAALGVRELNWSAQPWGGGGNNMAAAVQLADAAVSAGYARYVVAFRALAQGQFGRYGQSYAADRVRGAVRLLAPLRPSLSRAGLRAAHRAFPPRSIASRPTRLMEIALACYANAQRNPRAIRCGNAAHRRAVQDGTLDRRAVPSLRLLSGERRRRGDRCHDSPNARARLAQSSGGDRRRSTRPRSRLRSVGAASALVSRCAFYSQVAETLVVEGRLPAEATSTSCSSTKTSRGLR